MATYTNVSHIYVTWRMMAKAGSPWLGETWQSGLRLYVGSLKPLDTGRIDPVSNVASCKDASLTRSITNWSIQQGWAGADVGGSIITDSDKDAIVGAVGTMLANRAPNLAAEYELESVRLYPIASPDTATVTYGNSCTAPDIYEPSVTTFDPAATTMQPPQEAYVTSLYSAVRGPSGRGRFYWGGIATNNMSHDGLIIAARGDDFRNAVVGLCNGIRAIDGGVGAYRYTPVIWSKGATSTGPANSFSVISNVRTNDEFDTQRRREDQRDPVWTTTNLT